MGPPQEGKRMSGASSMSLEAHRPPRSTGLKPSRRASCSTVDLESEQSLQIRTWRRIKGTLPLFIAQFCISEANFPKTTYHSVFPGVDETVKHEILCSALQLRLTCLLPS